MAPVKKRSADELRRLKSHIRLQSRNEGVGAMLIHARPESQPAALRRVRWWVTDERMELAPDFALPDAHGQMIRLSDYRGHPLVLSFLRGFR